MKKSLSYLTISLLISFYSIAQNREIPIDTIVVTNHSTTIKGKNISYQAQTGTQPVWGEKDNAIATLFYTYYRRTDIKKGSERPLIFSFNGGPGAGSLWMHMGYTGPRILKVDSEGYPFNPMDSNQTPTLFLMKQILFL